MTKGVQRIGQMQVNLNKASIIGEASPKNEQRIFKSLGAGKFCTALALSGSVEILPSETKYPRYLSSYLFIPI